MMDEDRLRIRDELKRLLVETLALDVAPADIRDDEPLFEAGLGVDSVEALALLTAIERRFGVAIPDDDIGLGLFQDIDALARVVERHAARAGAPS
jgi:acyl carrier protein